MHEGERENRARWRTVSIIAAAVVVLLTLISLPQADTGRSRAGRPDWHLHAPE